jgi:lactosylceramide 4-alpha-galactosyltransferase
MKQYLNNLARKRSFMILLLSSCLCLVIYKLITTPPPLPVLTCFDKRIPDEHRLDNLMHAPPVHGKNIFFHETSCSTDGVVRLNARQACAIESAAAQNPDWEIFVLYAVDVGYRNTTPLPLIDAITTYANVNLKYVNITEYTQDTPLEKWILRRKLFESIYLNSHFSDVMRYLSLFKFGGTYLDMDVVVKNSFNPLQSNYAGAESKEFVAAGVLNFEHTGFGHKIGEMCLRDLLANFDGELLELRV